MEKKIILCLMLILCIIYPAKIFSQDNIGVKLFGLSIHPKGAVNSHLMSNKLDKNGYLVLNFGLEFIYEKFLYKDIVSAKIIQALYTDCATRLGGFTHIGIRARIIKKGKHNLYGGIGPTIVYRRNWFELNEYIHEGTFKGGKNNNWQYLFLWYGGEFEYKYTMTDKFDFSVSLVPGYPDLISLAFGINFKLK